MFFIIAALILPCFASYGDSIYGGNNTTTSGQASRAPTSNIGGPQQESIKHIESRPRKRYRGLGAVIHWVGQAGKWLWNKALKPAGKAIGQAASWVWNKGISPAASWIWHDAFGFGSKGRKGIIGAGRWFGEEILGINSNGKKGIAAAASWVGNAVSDAWHWATDDVGDAIETFGQ